MNNLDNEIHATFKRMDEIHNHIAPKTKKHPCKKELNGEFVNVSEDQRRFARSFLRFYLFILISIIGIFIIY